MRRPHSPSLRSAAARILAGGAGGCLALAGNGPARHGAATSAPARDSEDRPGCDPRAASVGGEGGGMRAREKRRRGCLRRPQAADATPTPSSTDRSTHARKCDPFVLQNWKDTWTGSCLESQLSLNSLSQNYCKTVSRWS